MDQPAPPQAKQETPGSALRSACSQSRSARFQATDARVPCEVLHRSSVDGEGRAQPLGLVTLTRRGNGEVTVTLRGEIDLSNAAELRERISTCLTDGATHLTVDMTALDFIDCAGISALAMAIHQLDGRDRLVVRNPPRSASMIIELTGLVAGVTVEKGPFVERAKDNGS